MSLDKGSKGLFGALPRQRRACGSGPCGSAVSCVRPQPGLCISVERVAQIRFSWYYAFYGCKTATIEKVHMQNLNAHRTLLSPYVIGLCILTILLALSAVPLQQAQPAYAATSSELFAQADDIMGRADALQTDLNAAQADYDQALEENEAATKAMNEADARAKAAEARIAELQKRLADRAHTMYKSGPAAFLDVLFGVSSFDEFLTSWDMIEKIGEQDADLVQETKDMRTEAESARKEYSVQKDIAAAKMSQADSLKTQITATQATLKAEAEKLTADAMDLQVQEELEAERARQAAAAAEAMRKQLENGKANGNAGRSVVSGSGIFTHPCPTTSGISSPFGWRSFDNSFHQGCDFAAPEGTPIYAADKGTVLYATYDGGYNGGAGNWVVIAHGNGVVTKYMHASAVYVSVGQQVERGQNIAAVGNTGNSFGAHLHFQVEVNGVAVDPLLFL